MRISAKRFLQPQETNFHKKIIIKVLAEQVNAVQMVLDGKEAHQVPQLQFREDGTFMGAQHVKLPVEYDPLEASLHAMTGVIKELSESYHVKKKKKRIEHVCERYFRLDFERLPSKSPYIYFIQSLLGVIINLLVQNFYSWGHWGDWMDSCVLRVLWRFVRGSNVGLRIKN